MILHKGTHKGDLLKPAEAEFLLSNRAGHIVSYIDTTRG